MDKRERDRERKRWVSSEHSTAAMMLKTRYVRFGPNWDFSDHILEIKNALKSDMKKSRVCPILDQSDNVIQICHPWFKLSRVLSGMVTLR